MGTSANVAHHGLFKGKRTFAFEQVNNTIKGVETSLLLLGCGTLYHSSYWEEMEKWIPKKLVKTT